MDCPRGVGKPFGVTIAIVHWGVRRFDDLNGDLLLRGKPYIWEYTLRELYWICYKYACDELGYDNLKELLDKIRDGVYETPNVSSAIPDELKDIMSDEVLQNVPDWWNDQQDASLSGGIYDQL